MILKKLFQQGGRYIALHLFPVLGKGNLGPFLAVLTGFFLDNRYLSAVSLLDGLGA